MIVNLHASVHTDRLSYSAYPIAFPQASKELRPADIELVFRGIDEYQILLRSGDIVLFPREKELALREFLRMHAIGAVGGVDPWPLLCDPFLDTEFTPEQQRLTIQRLGELGFGVEEIASIRARIRSALEAYVFRTWEWQMLGLPEVLITHEGHGEEFFHWVFSISRRAFQHSRAADLYAPVSPEARRLRLGSELERLGYREEFRSARPGVVRRKWWHFDFGLHKLRADISASVDAAVEQNRKLHEIARWIEQHHDEPHRRYHNLDHVLQVMSLLNSMKPEVSTAALVAGLFHDSIYSTSSRSNEERSAAAMREQLAPLGLPAPLLERASSLILYTRKHPPTADPEEQVIHDADLGIFGQSRPVYAAYAAGIREEYRSVPDMLFRPGRMKILSSMLERAQRGRFYYRLDPVFEPAVSDNLAWEIAALTRARS